MPDKPYRQMTEDELVLYTAGHHGAAGAGAQAEMTRRLLHALAVNHLELESLGNETASLRLELGNSSSKMESMTRTIQLLTAALFVLAIIQVGVSVWGS